jgi:hypothetical protein
MRQGYRALSLEGIDCKKKRKRKRGKMRKKGRKRKDGGYLT